MRKVAPSSHSSVVDTSKMSGRQSSFLYFPERYRRSVVSDKFLERRTVQMHKEAVLLQVFVQVCLAQPQNAEQKHESSRWNRPCRCRWCKVTKVSISPIMLKLHTSQNNGSFVPCFRKTLGGTITSPHKLWGIFRSYRRRVLEEPENPPEITEGDDGCWKKKCGIFCSIEINQQLPERSKGICLSPTWRIIPTSVSERFLKKHG